jgi:hypothetical protein
MASANIGMIAELLPEVREEVRKNLRSQNGNIKESVNILRTCRQLYHETFQHIYTPETLTFKISPIYDRKSWIGVTSSFGITLLKSLSHAKHLALMASQQI